MSSGVATAGPFRARATAFAVWAVTAAYVAWRFAAAGGPLPSGIAGDLAFLPFYLFAAAACAAASRRFDGRTRTAWRLAAVAWLLSWFGEMLYLFARHPLTPGWTRTLGDVLDATYYPLMAAALLALSVVPRGLAPRLGLAVDGLVAVVGVHAIAWYFVYRHLPPGEPIARHVEEVLGSGMGEALVLFAASVALARPRPDSEGAALHALAAGCFATALGDLVAAHHHLAAPGTTVLAGDVLLAVASALVATGGLLAWDARAFGEDRRWLAAALRLAGYMPGLTTTAVLALLGYELLRTSTASGAIAGLSAGTAALATLVMVRLGLAERALQAEAAARAVQEERLQHAQRLEVLGHLTGAVAHDFNNLLTGLGGTAQALEDRLPRGAEELLELHETVRRGTALCSQLLGIGRREPDRLAPLDLRAAVEGTLPMLRRLVPRTVEMHATGEVGPARALADRTQIEVALLNLAVNARDAMPRGGTLWINADAVEVAAGSHWDRRGVPSGRYARLSVSDSGCGMDEATRRRATEPFFTTKPPGVGTGLGLATVRGIASRCGGRLVIDSAPGRGTSVSMLLPLAGAASRA